MTHEIITQDPITASVEEVTAFLYLRLAEQPPMEDYDPEDPEAVAAVSAADDLWYGPQDPSKPVVDREDVRRFIVNVGYLLGRLQTLYLLYRTFDDDYEWSEEIPNPWTEEEIQAVFYSYAKSCFGEDKKEIRQFFIYLYQIVTDTSSGPRWGQFVMIYGLDNFIEKLQSRFSDPLRIRGAN